MSLEHDALFFGLIIRRTEHRVNITFAIYTDYFNRFPEPFIDIHGLHLLL